jgi:hypothetical protein
MPNELIGTRIGDTYLTGEQLKEYTAGEDYPPEDFTERRGIYTGKDSVLYGQSAMVFTKLGDPFIYVQFDQPCTKKCFGWWKFSFFDFILTLDDDSEPWE